MNNQQIIIALIFTVFSSTGWAYGGGPSKSTKACTKPKFSEFKPAHLAEVSPGSEFSFVASSITSPSSVSVEVKKIPVEVSINKSGSGYLIKGKLPESLQNDYARVTINAKSTSKCAGSGGWLLKVQ